MPAYDPSRDHLLLFDGVCHLCSTSVQWFLLHDTRGILHFCPIQSPLGRQLYKEHQMDPDQPATILLLTPHGSFSQGDAVIEIARLLGNPWKILAWPMKLLPRPVRDWAYRFIARNRYRWFGKKDACFLPKPEWKQRFIE